MGRRGFGHQPADERRGVTAPRAVAFREAADARYRRTSLTWVPPVVSVLRTPPQLVRIDNRVHVDARTLRVFHQSLSGVLSRERLEPKAQPVYTRLVERARRDESSRPVHRPPASDDRGRAPESARRVAMVDPPVARPVSMVLAKAAATAAPAISTTASRALGEAWPPETTVPRRPHAATTTETGAGLSNADVTRLTERVVAAIDRRMISARERLGG
jgi:hypothetical protein